MHIEFKVDFNLSDKKIKGRYKKAQEYLDTDILTDTEPFLPFRQGIMKSKSKVDTNIGSGQVVYDTPYAKYLYHGKVMVGRPPKTVTNRDLQFGKEHHPTAQAFWFEASKSINEEKWVRNVKRILDGEEV